MLIDRRGQPLAVWRWRTFPVYFALTLGLLIGYVLGFYAPRKGVSALVIYAVILFLFSLALSRYWNRVLGERLLRDRARKRAQRSGE